MKAEAACYSGCQHYNSQKLNLVDMLFSDEVIDPSKLYDALVDDIARSVIIHHPLASNINITLGNLINLQVNFLAIPKSMSQQSLLSKKMNWLLNHVLK